MHFLDRSYIDAQAPSNIEWSVAMCFRDWLAARGGDGSIEVKQAIVRIEHLLVTNEFSDRVYDLRDGDTKTVRNLLAYRKVGVEGVTEEFWVPPTVFDKEFVVGVSKVELVKELQRLGWLTPAAYDGNPSVKRRFNGKQIRVFVSLPLLQNGNFKGASPASLDETVTGTEVHPGNTEAPLKK
jgi:putative DNA primase/helicase